MRRVGLYLLGLVPLFAIAACGPPAVVQPGQPVPAAAIHRLTAIVSRAVKVNGGHPVEWATAVVTTHAKALTSASHGDTTPGGKATVYLVTIKGHFICNSCTGPAGARAPTGRYMSLVINAKNFEGTDFGLSPKPPSVPPAQLGPVTHLPL